MTNLASFIAESNRIEGITRPPTVAEISEMDRFLSLPTVSIDDLVALAGIFQPDAALRDRIGLNVRIGDYYPPKGGPYIRAILSNILADANQETSSAYQAHHDYERLHPFTDGNGRSGRALWLWMMQKTGGAPLGFLHHWYYQSLAEERK